VLAVAGAWMLVGASSCSTDTPTAQSQAAQSSDSTIVAQDPTATAAPTPAPTQAPTQAPTRAPTQAPTRAPTQAPTRAPTAAPVAHCYIDPEGNCYRAGEFCPKSLHGQTVQGENGPIKCEDNNGWRWEPA
jgi:hypothetical protein